MTELSNNHDMPATKASVEANNTLDFHTVIGLKACGGNPVRVNIDSSVTEQEVAGDKRPTLISASERIKLTENGRDLPEHGFNRLTLTENGKDMHLSDYTHVSVLEPEFNRSKDEMDKAKPHGESGSEAMHRDTAGGIKHGDESEAGANSKDVDTKSKDVDAILPKLTIEGAHKN